jgi:hypothetical protein
VEAVMTVQSDLFDTAAGPMTRTPDHEASELAADTVRERRLSLQYVIFEIVRRAGPITAIEVEEYDGFQHLAPSTVRKRCSELVQMGYLREGAVVAVTTKCGRKTKGTSLTTALRKWKEPKRE